MLQNAYADIREHDLNVISFIFNLKIVVSSARNLCNVF